jgi:hypothetical protein
MGPLPRPAALRPPAPMRAALTAPARVDTRFALIHHVKDL